MALRTFGFLMLALAISLVFGIGSQSLVGAGYLANGLVVLGPALAAAAFVKLSGHSVRQWLITDWRETRFAWWWIAIPPACLLITGTAFLMAGGEWNIVLQAAARPGLILLYTFSICVVGLFEEMGWRGWLLREWLGRATPLTATLMTTAVWGAWHFPKLMIGPAVAAALLCAIAVQSIILTSLWSRFHGRTALAAIMHGSFNAPILWLEGHVSPEIALEGFLHATGIYALGALVLVALQWRWWIRPAEALAPGREGRARL